MLKELGIIIVNKSERGASPKSCLSWWVEWESWWNGNLGGTGILVEWASWWNGHLGGTGILVERASWWNGHLGGTGILPVSFPAGMSQHWLLIKSG